MRNKRALKLAYAILLFLFLTLITGCISEKQIENLSPEENTNLTLADIALKISDFPESGWIQGKTNASGDVYETVFFRAGFSYGEITTIENRVHFYSSFSEAEKDFAEAAKQLNETIAVKNAGIGKESVFWEKGSEVYILFRKKNTNVELYAGSGYSAENLKVLARKMEGRI